MNYYRMRGMTLIEVMIAAVVLLIAIIGTSGFRYYSALDARKAEIQLNAAKITQTFCDMWKGIDGDPNFTPEDISDGDMTITAIDEGPAKVFDNLLDNYKVNYEGVDYYLTCSYKQEDTDLKKLNVITAWQHRGEGENGYSDVDKTFSLTTYAYDKYGN